MYQYQDSLVTFTFIYLATFILVCSSQTPDNILRCNLLFNLIGHFISLLKDVNISFFLSIKMQALIVHRVFSAFSQIFG